VAVFSVLVRALLSTVKSRSSGRDGGGETIGRDDEEEDGLVELK
jgi:hypothetical protein